MEEEFSLEKFHKVSQEALSKSAYYVKDAIDGKVDLTDYLVKPDKGAVSVVDNESENIARPIIQTNFSDCELIQEEAGNRGNPNSNIRIYHDALDGSWPFLLGGICSTLILATYNKSKRRVEAVATMEPESGRFWYADRENNTTLSIFNYDNGKFEGERDIHVNNQDIKRGKVLVDCTTPFSRPMDDGPLKLIFSQRGRRKLTDLLEETGASEFSFGTNGLHYSLIALGRPLAIGTITTAKGGPYDVAPLLLVKQAGGAAQCYEIREGKKRRLFPLEHAEDIERADIVIAANNPQNLEKIFEAARKAVSYKN
jgi:fructose-1,6-bisphosphatase/inositol monophosphatase family enzyme